MIDSETPEMRDRESAGSPPISYRNILVIQTGFVGDMVLTTPLLRSLRLHAPDSRITLLHSPRSEGIVRYSSRIDRRIVYDKGGNERGAASFLRLCRSLNREKYDLVISPHRSVRSGLLALASGADRRIGFDHSSCGLFYTDLLPWSRWESTFVRRKLRLLEPLGIDEGNETPELEWGPEEEKSVDELLQAPGRIRGWVVIAVGAAWPTKMWPADSFRELAAAFGSNGYGVAAIGSGSDREAGAIAARGGAVDLTGRTSLAAVAALLSRASLFVGGDSGTLHMARAARIPAIALFGPTGPEQFRFDPLVRLIRSDAPCARGSDHGGRTCPTGNWICMPGISPAHVMKEATAILAAREGERGDA